MSTVVLDTITGKSTATTITIGSTPVVSASANSMTIRGEGSAQTSIQQGLAKTWCQWNASQAIQDSFNCASITDTATGIATFAIATDMANDDYSLATAGSNGASSGTIYSSMPNTLTAATFAVNILAGSNTFALSDRSINLVVVHGDLA